MMNENSDKSSTVVIIGGKRMTIADVKRSFADLEFLSKESSMRIVTVLMNAEEPLTREQIAEKAKLSKPYTIDILKRLINYDYIVSFHIGKGKLLYYAITEQGYDAIKSKESEK